MATNKNTQAENKNLTTKEFKELLGLLQRHPDLVREVVFDSARLNHVLADLLRVSKAPQAPIGQDPTTWLRYMAGSADGYPNAQCLEQTKYFCGKGTGIYKLYACGGSTGHPYT